MSIKNAFTKFKTILGENAWRDDIANARFGQSTNGVAVDIAGVLLPETSEQVQKIVAVANDERVPLYPISMGNNWGYGSASPVTAGNVIVDLSHLNKIVDFDEDLGIVTLQPGVTQQILHEYLAKRNLPFVTPVHGGGPNCSILGNILERGYGITPVADHFSTLTTITAVLGDGTIYRSAYEDLGNVLLDRTHKYGIGPYLDGIFTQGNFGIVVQASIALARKPARTTVMFFTLRNAEDLPNIVSKLPRLFSTLGSSIGGINLMNQERVDAMVQATTSKSNTPPWTGAGVLYGEKTIIKASKKIIRTFLSPHVRHFYFVDIATFKKWLPFLKSLPLPKILRAKLETLARSVDLFTGIPSTVALPLAYHKSGTVPKNLHHSDPARDGCGLIWFTPIIPMKKNLVKEYTALVRKVCAQYAFEPLITLSTLNERCIDSSVPILFDRNDPEATKRAHDCYDALWKEVAQLKLLPYRIPANEMWRLNTENIQFFKTVRKIKKVLDPRGIIAPGRYSGDAKRTRIKKT